MPSVGVLLGLFLAIPAIAADDAGKPGVVAFNASVRVEVDASGKPVKVEAPADLPESIRSYIEKRVASWQYAPARENGLAAAAVTFVDVGACAIPVAEGYRLGLDYKGNGPRLLTPSGRLPPPIYPKEALRSAYSGTFKVEYAIQADGSTRLEDVETLEGGNKLAKLFNPTLKRWVEGLRYEPEHVNGRPVETTMRFPVEFKLDTGRSDMGSEQWRKNYLAELQARAIASNECIAASAGNGLQPVAENSPVKVIPTPAG
jgi:hypothetical protein